MLTAARSRVAALIKQVQERRGGGGRQAAEGLRREIQSARLAAGNFVRVVYFSLKPPA